MLRRSLVGLAATVAASVAASLVVPLATGARAAEEFKLRASLDTSATHARTMSVADYLQKLEAASGGRIKTELFHSGQLFRDRDVAKALRQGGTEMAVPGNWVLTGFVPDTDVFQLPVFFGQSIQTVYGAIDGRIGGHIAGQLEQKLGVKVLGPWLPLGYQNTYSTGKPINSFDDLAGMKIRNSGGAGQALRATFFKSTPNMTAWPDVPLALSQGTFDGLSSTDESLASAKLWESGVKYAFADHEFVGQYIPLISDTFWKKLPPDLQKLMVDVWAQNIGTYRTNMEQAQLHARKTLESNGVKYADPTPETLASIRTRMMPTQDAIAKELRITPEMQKLVGSEMASTH